MESRSDATEQTQARSSGPAFTDAVHLVRGFEEALCNLPGVKALHVFDSRVHDDCVLYGGCWDGRVAKGRAEVIECFRLWSQGFQQRHVRIHACFGAPFGHGNKATAFGYNVCVRWTFTGINDGPLAGMRPTGRRLEFSGVSLHRVRAMDGKIVESMRMWDTAAFLSRLGLTVSLPAPSMLGTAAGAVDGASSAVFGGVKGAAVAAGLRQPSVEQLPGHQSQLSELGRRVPDHVADVTEPHLVVGARGANRTAQPSIAAGTQPNESARRMRRPWRWLRWRRGRNEPPIDVPDPNHPVQIPVTTAVHTTGVTAPGVVPSPSSLVRGQASTRAGGDRPNDSGAVMAPNDVALHDDATEFLYTPT